MTDDYKNGFIDGFSVGFIQGTDEGFTMGKGQQAKEIREKWGSIIGEGLQYMKKLKQLEKKSEIIAKPNKEKSDTILQRIKIKDKV